MASSVSAGIMSKGPTDTHFSFIKLKIQSAQFQVWHRLVCEMPSFSVVQFFVACIQLSI